MATLGVSSWDFAYPTGNCPVESCGRRASNIFQSKSESRRACAELKSKQPQDVLIAARKVVTESDDAIDGSPSSSENNLSSQSQPQARSRSSFHIRSRKDKTQPPELRTYLLSSPTPRSVAYPQVKTTIATMLLTPRTQLIYLVPQSEIICRQTCEISRLPRAGGSGIQILPVCATVDDAGLVTLMRCDDRAGKSGVSSTVERENSQCGVDEVVRKVLKYTKARAFDGYIAFEDDRDAWTFLERVGKGVTKCAAMKKGDKQQQQQQQQ